MSRNFDLLQRAGKQDTLIAPSSGDSPASNNGHCPLGLRNLGDEEVIKLVQRVFVFTNSDAPRVVVFASVQGDGSSGICSRAGDALAVQGIGSVCLVDGNLHAASLHQLLGAGKVPGLTDAAVKPGPIRDFAVRVGSGNFWVVPPGSPSPDAQRLFSSDQMRLRMAELRKQFDYVLIDAPPLSSYSDAVLLGQMADGIVLIVEANSTRRDNARIVQDTLKSANVKLLGVVLNNRTFPIPDALYRKL